MERMTWEIGRGLRYECLIYEATEFFGIGIQNSICKRERGIYV